MPLHSFPDKLHPPLLLSAPQIRNLSLQYLPQDFRARLQQLRRHSLPKPPGRLSHDRLRQFSRSDALFLP
jgi:hypothetical protein